MTEPLIDQTRPFNLPIGADTASGSDLKMRFDSDDNVSHLVRGASNQTTIRDLGPAVQAVEIVGSQVTDAGALAVVQKAAGPPIVRAGITGTDAYVALFVLDRDCSWGYEGALATDLKAALYGLPAPPAVLNFIGGLGGSDVTPEHMKYMLGKALSTERGAPSSMEFIGL